MPKRQRSNSTPFISVQTNEGSNEGFGWDNAEFVWILNAPGLATSVPTTITWITGIMKFIPSTLSEKILGIEVRPHNIHWTAHSRFKVWIEQFWSWEVFTWFGLLRKTSPLMLSEGTSLSLQGRRIFEVKLDPILICNYRKWKAEQLYCLCRRTMFPTLGGYPTLYCTGPPNYFITAYDHSSLMMLAYVGPDGETIWTDNIPYTSP